MEVKHNVQNNYPSLPEYQDLEVYVAGLPNKDIQLSELYRDAGKDHASVNKNKDPHGFMKKLDTLYLLKIY